MCHQYATIQTVDSSQVLYIVFRIMHSTTGPKTYLGIKDLGVRGLPQKQSNLMPKLSVT